MSILLWIVQGLLAAAFLAHGVLLLVPPASIIEQMNATMSTEFRLFLGAAEIAAAVGLTFPGFTRLPGLFVPAAAAGVMIVMIAATILHINRDETSSAITTLVLLLLATFVAYMRWRVKPLGRGTMAGHR